jgi:hypothetical protein
MLERRRARYADEIETLEWYVQNLTLTDSEYHTYFRFGPRSVIEERRQRTLERLHWIRQRCEEKG